MDKFSAEAIVDDITWGAKQDRSYPIEAHIEQNDDGSYSVVARNRETGVEVRFNTTEEFGSDEPSDKMKQLHA